MANIEFTPQQVEELKSFYVIELEKTQRRAEEIKVLLEKLKAGNLPEPATKRVKVKTQKEIPLKNKKEITLHKEKEENTLRWEWGKFIIQVLQKKQKPLSRKEILKLYEQHNNTEITNYKNAMNAMAQSLFWLRVKNKKILSFKGKGKKEKLYGLTEWGANPVNKTITPETPKVKRVTRSRRKPKTVENEDNKHIFEWKKFIIETLVKQRRILSTKEFIQYAMKYFEIPINEKNKTAKNVSSALSRTEKNDKSIKFIQKEGVKGRSYGLTEWFDDDGKLIVDYK